MNSKARPAPAPYGPSIMDEAEAAALGSAGIIESISSSLMQNPYPAIILRQTSSSLHVVGLPKEHDVRHFPAKQGIPLSHSLPPRKMSRFSSHTSPTFLRSLQVPLLPSFLSQYSCCRHSIALSQRPVYSSVFSTSDFSHRKMGRPVVVSNLPLSVFWKR